MLISSHARVRILFTLVAILTIVSAFTISIVTRGTPSRASGPVVTMYQGQP